ncbi:Predicted flavoprotein [Providencia rustigianii]|nr:Predicted flavoprotein [Providencia rustigianii]
MPGVLKNAIDQGSRPWGDNSWDSIPAGILGVSIGNISTAIAQQHLRNSLAFLNMPTMNQPECYLKWYEGMVDEQGNISPKSKDFLQPWVDSFVKFVNHNSVN